MAEIVIFAEQSISGFGYNSSFGCYFKAVTPTPFVFIDGATYIIVWDGTSYECQAMSGSMNGYFFVCVGNGAIVGRENTGEPFAMAYNTDTGYMNIYAFDANTSHTIAVYRVAEEETVYQINGFTLTAIAEAIRAKTDIGETMTPAEFPYNIRAIKAESEDALSFTLKSGNFVLDEDDDRIVVIEHNMGVVPDIFIVAFAGTTTETQAFLYAVGFSSAMHEALGGGYINTVSGSSVGRSLDMSIENTSSNAVKFGNLRDATAATITVGGTNNPLLPNKAHDWFAISGIV